MPVFCKNELCECQGSPMELIEYKRRKPVYQCMCCGHEKVGKDDEGEESIF